MEIVYDGNNSNSVCFVGKLCSFENLLVRVDHSQSDLNTSVFKSLWLFGSVFKSLWESRSDQLSQVGSQMNIITFKNTLLYNYHTHVRTVANNH